MIPQPPFFRALKLGAFATITSLMGEAAEWETALPVALAGVGLFKDPTGKDEVSPRASRAEGTEYTPEQPEFRYMPGQFPGLYEAVRRGEDSHTLRLSDGRRFLIAAFEKKFDGETYVALLEPITRQSAPVWNL